MVTEIFVVFKTFLWIFFGFLVPVQNRYAKYANSMCLPLPEFENAAFFSQVDDNTESQDYQNCSVQFSHDSGTSSTTGTITSTATSKILGDPVPAPILICRNSPGSSSSDSLHSQNSESGRIALQIKFPEQGVFRGTLTYNDIPVQNGKFEIVVLNSHEAAAVQKNVVVKSTNVYYEGKLLAMGSEIQTKTRKIYISITSKQLVVKEYFWKLLPIRLATFRLSPNTKVSHIFMMKVCRFCYLL